MPPRSVSIAAGAICAVLLAACGPGTAGTAIVANSPGSIGTGEQRLVLALAGDDAELRGGPDLAVSARILLGGEPYTTVDTDWVWSIPDVRGFYTTRVDFPQPGDWSLVLEPADGPPTPPTPIGVNEHLTMPDVGDPAPPSETPTLEGNEISAISTDPAPDPRFYELSVAEAVSNDRPAVIVFASPAFCQTATCGPMLDTVKSVAGGHPEADFVHVEVYELGDTGGPLEEVPAVTEWGLQSEPWVFVVRADGIVADRFEGAISAGQLEEALKAMAGT